MTALKRRSTRPDILSRLVSPDDLPRLLDAGYRVFDGHLHTSASHDVMPAANVQPSCLYQHMVASGWDFVTFTDHDTMAAYAELDRELPNLVRGVEITIAPRRVGRYEDCHTLHINVYDLTARECRDLVAIAATGDFYALKAYLRERDLPHQLNHPTWSEVGDRPDWRFLPDIVREFEVIEAINHKREHTHNRIALKLLAEEYNTGVTGGSDSHVARPVYANLVRGGDFRECWERIRAGESYLLRQHQKAAITKDDVLIRLDHLRETTIGRELARPVLYEFGPTVDRIIHRFMDVYLASPMWLRLLQVSGLRAFMVLVGDWLIEKVHTEKELRAASQLYSFLETHLAPSQRPLRGSRQGMAFPA